MSISLHPDTPDSRTLTAPAATEPAAPGTTDVRKRNRLFAKYVALFVAVVGVALLSNGIFEVFFYYREHKASLIRIQREQAEAAAAKISQFVREIEGQLGWTAQLPWSAGSLQDRRFDALRLLRQVPAITELSQVDAAGKERLRVSRLDMDVVDSGLDFSKDPKFVNAVINKIYYGPVYFRRESEPYMTLSLAGTRREAGVSIAEVNLKLIRDVVSQIKVGEHGRAYVVGAKGRLIAHPDISLVLRSTDMSGLAQVQAAMSGNPEAMDPLRGSKNIAGEEVLTAYAPITPLGWTMFVELPVTEAYASLYQALQRLAIVLAGALLFAVLAGIFLARRMVVPIQALRAGAERIGSGDFTQRIDIKTGDELEGLANQFNDMGGRLQESYADLENKVERRTGELRESLQQQTAVGDVLKVISRSAFDLQPVLDTLVQTAARLCDAEMAFILRREGERYVAGAAVGFSADYISFLKSHPIVADRRTITGRAALERRAVQILDVAADPEYSMKEAVTLAKQHTALGVPLLRENEPIGVIVLARQRVEAFTEKQIELVTTFADQAVIAIENVRLFDEVQTRTTELSLSLEYQTATSEVLNVISRSPSDIQPVLDTIVETAGRLCDSYDTIIFLREGEVLRVAAHLGPISLDFDRLPIGPGAVSGRAILERRSIHVHDVTTSLEFPEGQAMGSRLGYRTILATPLLKENDAIGAIIVRRDEVRPFAEKQITLLQTFADQAVIAIGNVRLFEEVQETTRELSLSLDDLRTAQDRLVQTEKLASLGQLTAGIAHEIKNPLNFVNNFSALSGELIDELNEVLKDAPIEGKTREEIDELTHMLKGNLEKVVQHGKRADSIVKNMLLHSREGAGEHRPADINAIVEESLNLAYHGARAEKPGFNITLTRDFDPAAGMIDVYPQEITRVFLNLISNGFYATAKRREAGEEGYEPTLLASTKTIGNRIEIRIRDNGTGIPAEVREKMFNPFFTTKPAGEGTGLGLSMSHDIVVKQHGGSIDVVSEPGSFTEFIITLPRNAAAKAIGGGSN
jgi:signal transduction histidine kinase